MRVRGLWMDMKGEMGRLMKRLMIESRSGLMFCMEDDDLYLLI